MNCNSLDLSDGETGIEPAPHVLPLQLLQVPDLIGARPGTGVHVSQFTGFKAQQTWHT